MRGAHGNPIYTACEGCGASIRTYPSRRAAGRNRFCSLACRNKHASHDVTCQGCGKVYSHLKSQNGGKYCSIACLVAGKSETRTCKRCGTLFSTPKSRIEKGRGVYCSPQCYWVDMEVPEALQKVARREYVRKYRREHPEWAAAVKHRRRVAESSSGHFTAREWAAVKVRQNHQCAACGKSAPEIKLTVDHIIPISKGGSNNIDNIQGLCRSCNSRKHNRMPAGCMQAPLG